MTESESAPTPVPSLEEIQKSWQELTLRVGQLEAERSLMAQETKTLRFQLDKVIEHRQKSHSELVLIVTSLVSKLPLNDVGVIITKLVEHNTSVSHFLAALIKGGTEESLPQPVLLKDLEQAKRDLLAAIKPVIEDLIGMETPLETDLLQPLATEPQLFFTPRFVRANRGYLKGQVARERVVKDFGDAALVFFNDMTTDPKLNPNPKPEEIMLSFKPEFEAMYEQNPSLLPEKRTELLSLYQRVQRSKASTDATKAQRHAFQKLTFLVELLHYYQNQNTETPDVIFAQRLPVLVEQLATTCEQQSIDEKLITQLEELLAYIISPDHRLMVINNMGKGGGTPRTLKFVLRLRIEKAAEAGHTVAGFVKHLVPLAPEKPQPTETIAAILRLLPEEIERIVVLAIMSSDRLRAADAEGMARSLAVALGMKGLDEQIKAQVAVTPEVERQLAWARVKDFIGRRQEPGVIAGAIRDRLHAKYDSDEIKESWLALIESEPISLIRVFCQIPYLPDGRTDSIARPVMETYVTRLTHEKYASTYHKIITSLRNMFRAKADSPTLLNFTALVRWVDPAAANKICSDVGMPVPTQ
jgi:hypothetical protein